MAKSGNTSCLEMFFPSLRLEPGLFLAPHSFIVDPPTFEALFGESGDLTFAA